MTMTKSERHDLAQLIRKREKVMKSQASERSALLLAEFDAQSAKIHSYDDDAVWAEAAKAAEEAVLIASATRHGSTETRHGSTETRNRKSKRAGKSDRSS